MTTALPPVEPALADAVTARMAVVEQRLRDAVAHSDALAGATSRHLVDAGGKRLRPMLTLLCGHLGDGAADQLVDAAAVVELTHLATLYHDDVMDAAPVRRGAPSAHELWGNQIAVITGDLVFARASAIAAGLGPEAIRILAATFERLCLGQLHEVAGPDEGADPVAHYLQVLADKTASLIATSARFGAMFSGAGPDVEAALVAYGEAAGVAFQLADDVIDLTSDAQVTGKTPGTDLRDHVPTMPVLLLRERVAAGGTAADAELLALLDSDLSDDAVLAGAVTALRAHDVVAETRARAQAWEQRAIDALGRLPEGPVREALETFTHSLVDRSA
ncbi:polyprenyl synthetase family protein [Actinotalea fermentans]|uniref:Geranylgeranyl pyrophosphate synthase n=1 Tax=Actinotalea fermentans TaxID=43671 RepID=A0A511Z0E5_9CELL|nr:polyprenyl synthetase family protein [Actinotalea fermentans]KGM16204.1 geranylgeranyl pyrophosphate synthase [Actinotalea fermentans ATCC 43279 = JCM 9966 = DSM 3133]GEN80915.1 geranylgeranyl pyrophosphate synthase [Actinotalea fermentans]